MRPSRCWPPARASASWRGWPRRRAGRWRSCSRGWCAVPGNGSRAIQSEPVYREAVDRLLGSFERDADFDLRSLLFPEAGSEEEADRLLQRPSRALPALFITQYAQARLWMSSGIEPVSMIGHSMGEYTAACSPGCSLPKRRSRW
ncbi:MAG: acyltransferase domain-containing protein [Gemmatimonadota bacterium]|nr:acyltransferase domain-containing protein [Gemmatimonadota bacterium]